MAGYLRLLRQADFHEHRKGAEGVHRLPMGQVLFVAANAVIGLVIGVATATSPRFATLGLPTFAWLVLGMLVVELLAGWALRAHPSAIITMPSRIAALAISFVVCYAALSMLRSV